MRDDSKKWDETSESPDVYSSAALTVTQVWPRRQTVISGINVHKVTNQELVGWPGNIGSDSYALVLRRDRLVEVNGPERSDGWDEKIECAVSDMTDGYSVFDLKGVDTLPLLKRGAFVNPEASSRSVTRGLFDLPVLLYRREDPDHYTIHVGRAHAQTLKKAILAHIQSA